MLDLIVPPEKADHNDAILEVSAGVGGHEAMLFTGEILQMYTKYAAYKGWTIDMISYEEGEKGAETTRQVLFSIINRYI